MTYSAIPSAVQASAINTQIANTVQRLRQLNQLDVQANWRSYLGDLPPAQATQFNTWQSWRPVTLNSNRQVTWEKGQRVLWLGQRIVVPHNLQGYYLQGLMLRLGLTWWASLAQIYVNGQLVQAGDLFDSVARILLSRSVQIGQTIDVALRLVSPGHSNGALVRGICLYELASQTVNPTAEPAFVARSAASVSQCSGPAPLVSSDCHGSPQFRSRLGGTSSTTSAFEQFGESAANSSVGSCPSGYGLALASARNLASGRKHVPIGTESAKRFSGTNF
ncbi:MAG: hypothetical protein MUF72_12780 [Elainella sp. Prado103]|nr:hypothetical protein [Elainella sp. Prado103]